MSRSEFSGAPSNIDDGRGVAKLAAVPVTWLVEERARIPQTVERSARFPGEYRK